MYRQQRNYNTNLQMGVTEGAYKQAAPNRGGEVEDTFVGVRKQMSGAWHGFSDTKYRIMPDGRSYPCPQYFDVIPQDDENI